MSLPPDPPRDDPRAPDSPDDSDGPLLKPLQVHGQPSTLEFSGTSMSFGRAEDNDVLLSAEMFPSVSSHHCRIELRGEGDEVWVVDLGSRNGTLVNETSIEVETKLCPGDVVRLGSIGPRFLLVASGRLGETMFVDPEKVGKGVDLTTSRVEQIKEVLGVPKDSRIDELVETERRHNHASLVVAVFLIVGAACLGGWHLVQSNRDTREHAHEQISSLQQRLEEFQSDNRALADALDAQDTRDASAELQLTNAMAEIELAKRSFEEQKKLLQARLKSLEKDGSSSADAIALVREELQSTRQRVDMFDPVSLEQERLADVSRVRQAVVLLEVSTYLRNTETGNLLYEQMEEGYVIPNFDGLGTPFVLESTGSGFCVSQDGWIITNGHVVETADDDPMMVALVGLPIEPETKVEVVFSDETDRHTAEIHRVAYHGDSDLALVKITPFPDMPHIDDFSLEPPQVEDGSDVFLFGFPLGHFALQEGERVIASTFRGILSRRVQGQLQVDAGVHQGNSGGPVTDAHGKVIAVVVSVQSHPDSSIAYSMGYAIPIQDAKAVWPPK